MTSSHAHTRLRRPASPTAAATTPAPAPDMTARGHLDSTFTPSPRNHPSVRHLSDASSSSTVTFRTARSASTDPWSISGFGEEDPIMDPSGDEHEAMEVDGDVDVDGELKLKLELPEDDVVRMEHLQVADTPANSPTYPRSTPGSKRPRGRPRKHPRVPVDPTSKVHKCRSKTGCITCRKRKKKCDETKPHCSNCQKNNVVCQGYLPLTIWESGRGRDRDGVQNALIRRSSISRTESPTFEIPLLEMAPIIHGIVTPADRIFFDHYCNRLSCVLTVEEGPKSSAFRDLLLPLAVQHVALMHSILALSSCNIEYHEPYGKALLEKHEVDEGNLEEVEQRAEYHRERALELFNKSAESEEKGVVERDARSVRYGQILCRVVQNLAEGVANGEHRIHLYAFRSITKNNPDPIGQAIKPEFKAFLNEFFLFHIGLDDLISLPNARYGDVRPVNEEWNVPNMIDPEAVRLLGVQDGLFFFMSKITTIRNAIRDNMAMNIDPVVDYGSLFKAAEIDAGIRKWRPSWPQNRLRKLAGLLYKQMMWVYLWRTIYPPKTTTWQPEYKITEVVNEGLHVLAMFPPRDNVQTLLLAPTFIIGCAAFDPAQRPQIRQSIANIKEFTHLKNADRCLQVLDQVWRYMDEKDERSWDWQLVAHQMNLDFLAT